MRQHIPVVWHLCNRRWLAMAAVLGVVLFSTLRSQGQQLTFLNSIAGLSNPNAVAVGPDGSVYVTNPGDNLVNIYSPTGSFTGSLGSFLLGNPTLESPYGLAISSSNQIYVSDAGYSSLLYGITPHIDVFTPANTEVATFGTPGTGNGQFQFPAGIAINSSLGLIYVADSIHASTDFFQNWPFQGVAISAI